MKNNLPLQCYWCGKPLTKETKQREHVPPSSFFPKGYKNNLMTVPACKEHNQELSELDEKYQFLIKLYRTNEVAFNDLTTRVYRGLMRKEKENFLKSLEEKTKIKKINGKDHLLIQLDEHHKFIEKIMRGIYFYHKEKPIGDRLIDSISNRILHDKLDYNSMVDYLKYNLDPRVLTKGDFNNPDVFKYQYLDFDDAFIVFMQFYSDAEFICWIYPEDFSFENPKKEWEILADIFTKD